MIKNIPNKPGLLFLKGKNDMTRLDFKLNSVKTSITTIEGRKYLLAPVIILTEGVHVDANNRAAYYPREELKKNPQRWDGRPVTVFHPKMQNNVGDTIYISANSPEVLELYRVGKLFGVNYMEEDGIGKLKGELHLDIDKANNIDPTIIPLIQSGGVLEVSTGLWDDGIEKNGEWKGEKYTNVVSNIISDHLALLPGVQGACSWKDGCGVRANEKEDGDVTDDKKKVDGQKTNSVKGEEKVVKFKDRVDKIIANSTVYTEENREWLEGLEECPLSKIEDMLVNSKDGAEKVIALEASVVSLKADIAALTPTKPISNGIKSNQKPVVVVDRRLTMDEYIAQAPVELQGVLQDGIDLRQQRKDGLIQSILANENNSFSEDVLKGMDLNTLSGISNLAAPKATYVGRGGGPITNKQSEVPILGIANCFPEKGGVN